MKKVYIYGLVDPRNGELRYIGKTYSMQRRLWQHTSRPRNSHIGSWIKSLKNEGVSPEIFCLEEFDFNDVLSWQESERFWIETLKFYGARLTNMMGGGIGGMCHSEETKRKISQKVKGRKMPPEHGLKISAAKIGQKYKITKPHKPKKVRAYSYTIRKGIKLPECVKANMLAAWTKRKFNKLCLN
jgi:hypothetical protein